MLHRSTVKAKQIIQRAMNLLVPGGAGDSERVMQIIRSIPECSLNDKLEKHLVEMICIRPACAETYVFSSPLPPAFRSDMHFARRYVYHLQDVNVGLESGVCFCEAGQFLESYGSLRRWLVENPVKNTSSSSESFADASYTYVRSTAYYHFLLEEIPRLLWVLSHHPETHVLVREDSPIFVLNILDQLVVAGKMGEYRKIKTNGTAFFHSFLFTQAEAYSGFVHSDDLRQLRQTFLREPSPSRNPGDERLWISRRKSSRSFDNEVEVEAAVQDSGFKVIFLEEMNFQQQIDLFRCARVIAGGHGAGFSNILWCSPGTQVVEVFSPRQFVDCYARLSVQLGCNYEPLWAAATKGYGVVNIGQLTDALNRPAA